MCGENNWDREPERKQEQMEAWRKRNCLGQTKREREREVKQTEKAGRRMRGKERMEWNERNRVVLMARPWSRHGKMPLAASQAGRRQVEESSSRQTSASISGCDPGGNSCKTLWKLISCKPQWFIYHARKERGFRCLRVIILLVEIWN